MTLGLHQHVLNRLAFGPAPGDLDYVQKIGLEEWFRGQLRPGPEDDLPSEVMAQLALLPTLTLSPGALFRTYGPPALRAARAQGPVAMKAANQRANHIVIEARANRLLRAVASKWQFREVLTDFWFNHFNVWPGKGLCRFWTGAYERDAIRPHMFGRFSDLLLATAQHPAMLFYLDNWLSSAPGRPGARGRFAGFNENYGREVMELHTLGVNGGYRQADVDALALILTGWTMQPPRGRFHFDGRRHETRTQTLLGHRFSNTGAQQGREALEFLARHPSTARHLATQLVRYFVTDQPPARLVHRIATRWLETEGDLPEVYTALYNSPEFQGKTYRHCKFRTPYQYVVASTRASGRRLLNPAPLEFFLTRLGQTLYGCIQPNGYPVTADHWLDPDGVLLRLDFAVALGRGNLPVDRPRGAGGKAVPVALSMLLDTVGPVTPRVLRVAHQAPPALRAAVVLGGPNQLYV
ncbi:MAG: DUF1800 domain-containing protein [Acidiferrobacterales bacterium]